MGLYTGESNLQFSRDVFGVRGKYGCTWFDLQTTSGQNENKKITVSVSVYVNRNGKNSVLVIDEGSVFKDLINKFGKDKVTIKITLSTPFRGVWDSHALAEGSLSSKEMVVTTSQSGIAVCVDDSIQFPSDRWVNIFQRSGFKFVCKLTVEVFIKASPNLALPQATPDSDKIVMYKMLHDGILSDLEVSVGDGSSVPIKCHKAVLSAASPVFRAMFTTEMKESKTHQIEMVDMTEEGVRAFLAYIYYSDLETPKNDVGVAYELLRAAHKYDIVSGLEAEITKIFLDQQVEWIDMDVALRLFAFARHLSSGEDLKKKAVQVLKANLGALSQSQACNEMFEKDPAAAKELCLLAFAA